jgi:hypothetical protein
VARLSTLSACEGVWVYAISQGPYLKSVAKSFGWPGVLKAQSRPRGWDSWCWRIARGAPWCCGSRSDFVPSGSDL